MFWACMGATPVLGYSHPLEEPIYNLSLHHRSHQLICVQLRCACVACRTPNGIGVLKLVALPLDWLLQA
jgi:hypothetical protein